MKSRVTQNCFSSFVLFAAVNMLLEINLIFPWFYLLIILYIKPSSYPFSFDHTIFLYAPIWCTCLHSSKRYFIYDPAQEASSCWLVVKFSGRYFPGDFSFLLGGRHIIFERWRFSFMEKNTVLAVSASWIVSTSFSLSNALSYWHSSAVSSS